MTTAARRCECAYCVRAAVYLTPYRGTKGQIALTGDGLLRRPLTIRCRVNGTNILAVWQRENKIVFSDGKFFEHFTGATRHAHILCGCVYNNLVNIDERTRWTVNVAHVGSVPVHMLARERIVEADAEDIPIFIGRGRCGDNCTLGFDPSAVRVLSDPRMSTLLSLRHQPQHHSAARKKRARQCESAETMYEEEEEEVGVYRCEWRICSPPSEWTVENVRMFLLAHPTKAPILSHIEGIVTSHPSPMPHLRACFLHPKTQEEISMVLPVTILAAPMQYRPLVESTMSAGTSAP
jgi:hypothetical protein